MFIKRYILHKLIENRPKKEISLTVSPRQAPKTTLMNILQDYLKEYSAKFSKAAKIVRSLKSFISKYKPNEVWVLNLGFKEEVKIDNTLVKFLPFWKIIE